MQTISELRSKAAELRKIADKLESAAEALVELGGSNNGIAPSPTATSELGDLAELSGVDAIERILTDSRSHLSKKEILRLLSKRGKAIGDNTLQSYLSRDKRFRSYGRGKWGLVTPF